MRVLLIMPPEKRETLVHSTPPYSLLVLAASVRASNHQVKVLDLFTFGFDKNTFKQELKTFKPDVVGIGGMSCHHNEMLFLASLVKEYSTSCIVALGGIHATALPELLLENENIDVLFRGEADETFPEYLKNLGNGNAMPEIEGLCFKTKAGFKISEPAIVKNLDSLPLPAWDLLPPTLYKGAPHGFFYRKWPIGLVLSSRGCPHECTYCAAKIMTKQRWRAKSPDRIIKEILHLREQYGVQEIQFIDDNLTLDKKRVIELCSKIIELNMDIWFSCPNGIRIDSLNDDLLLNMKKAKFYSFCLGIESGEASTLKRIKKRLSPETIEKNIKMLKKYKFRLTGFFIIGFPFETYENIMTTIRFAMRLPIDSAAFTLFIPLPGAEDFDNLVKAKKIDLRTYDWNHRAWIEGNSQEIYENLHVEQLKSLQRKATLMFYLRPRIIFNLVFGMLKRKQFKNLLVSFKRMANYAVSRGDNK